MFSENVNNFIKENFYCDFNDKSFLKSIAELLVCETLLDGLINDVIVSSLSKKKEISAYDENSKMIIIDLEEIKKYIFRMKRKGLILNVNEDYYSFFFYEALFENVVFLVQKKMEACLTNNEPIFKLLRDSSSVMNGNYKLDYTNLFSPLKSKLISSYLFNQNYNYFPFIRHARACSFETVLSVYQDSFPFKLFELVDLKNVFLEILLVGYRECKNTSCLVEKFYQLIGREDIFREYDFSSYETHEKFLYGMPLSDEELKKEITNILTLK